MIRKDWLPVVFFAGLAVGIALGFAIINWVETQAALP